MSAKYIFKGRIEVICGSMFSGKTEELINRIKKVELNGESFIVFRPKIDSRNPDNKIISHANNEISASIISSPEEILDLSKGFHVIGIDEAQFFDQSLVEISICVETGNPAGYSFRKDNSQDLVLIGEKKEYIPLSREAFIKKMANRNKK